MVLPEGYESTDTLQLIPDTDGKHIRENMKRIEEWAKKVMAMIEALTP